MKYFPQELIRNDDTMMNLEICIANAGILLVMQGPLSRLSYIQNVEYVKKISPIVFYYYDASSMGIGHRVDYGPN